MRRTSGDMYISIQSRLIYGVSVTMEYCMNYHFNTKLILMFQQKYALRFVIFKRRKGNLRLKNNYD